MGPKAQAVLHWYLLNPEGRVRDCAKALGLRPGWVAQLVQSDSFKAEYAVRARELGAESVLSLKARLEALRLLAAERAEELLVEGKLSERAVMDLLKSGPEPAPVQPQLHFHVTATELMEARKIAEQYRESVPRKDERLLPVGSGEGVRG
jgi:hypothetical protein